MAKAELRRSGTRGRQGIGLLVGAVVAELLLLVFVSVSAWWGSRAVHRGPVVSAGGCRRLAIVALILFLVGKRELERVRGLRKPPKH